jgi:hypothetical protein
MPINHALGVKANPAVATDPLATLLTQVTNPLDQVTTLLPMATWPRG